MPKGIQIYCNEEGGESERVVSRLGRSHTSRSQGVRYEGMGPRPGRKGRVAKGAAHAKAETARRRLKKVVGLKPYPCELEGVIQVDQADHYRFLECPGYSLCLGVARVGDWSSFTCRVCPIYKLYCSDRKLWTKKIRQAI